MHSIIAITIYMGALPDYFRAWLKSCEYNTTIDFLVVTDQKVDYRFPDNVKICNYTLEDIKARIEAYVGIPIWLEHPRKLCDFKPVYGPIFPEYTEKYDFWACCDIDLVFGDIRKYITEEILGKYDKIMRLGHITFYRNVDQCNRRYKCEGGRYKFSEVFNCPYNVVFDEIDYNMIYRANGFSIYDEDTIFLDIIPRFPYMKDCKRKTRGGSIFVFREGKVYQCFYNENEYEEEEFMYIHFSGRNDMYVDSILEESFYISGKGIRSVGESDITEAISLFNGKSFVKDSLFYLMQIIKEHHKWWKGFILRNMFRLSKAATKNLHKKREI